MGTATAEEVGLGTNRKPAEQAVGAYLRAPCFKSCPEEVLTVRGKKK